VLPWISPSENVTVAVAPFKSLGNDQKEEILATGIQEDIITTLGRIHPERMAVMPGGQDTAGSAISPIREIRGQVSPFDYLLLGSVRRIDNRVRVAVQLVRVKDQSRIWGNIYDRNWVDILGIETDIATDVSNEVLEKFAANELFHRFTRHKSQSPKQVDSEAYDDYLYGRYFWNKRTPDSLLKAIDYFEKSTARDPNYAPAYSGLADCYSLLGSVPNSVIPPREAFPKAEAAAEQALRLDEGMAEAHVSLGYAHLAYDWNYPEAEKEFLRAIQLRPSYAPAHQYYAYYLTTMNLLPEAIAQRRLAVEEDPVSPLFEAALGEAYYLIHDNDAAIEACKRSLDLDPTFLSAYATLGRSYSAKGMHKEALQVFQRVVSFAPDQPALLSLLGYEYAVSGRTSDAKKILQRLRLLAQTKYVPGIYSAVVELGLGDKTAAMSSLEVAYQERCDYLVNIGVDPMADPLRNDARFVALLKQLRLPNNGPVVLSR
jgi:TolB-like protein/Tfp pilus assembly protein PilF